MIFSADEGADVGQDGETPVTDDYKEGDNKFTGKIARVTVELKEANVGSKADAKYAFEEAVAKKAASD
ncbi:MAG: hypothetical protein HY287_06510 [Planctomycetes bacterium]|nr:hypothetical protein [Planctomycetota bacterium]MBI3833965.1 hypothetical protein [Planctomycetota bacterium]